MAKVCGTNTTSLYIFIFFVVIFNTCNNVAANIEKLEQYDLYSPLPDISSSAYMVKLRAKRQTVPADQKNQFQIVTENATAAVAVPVDMATSTQNAIGVNADASVMVKYNASEHRLLGENGTGQRILPLDDPTKITPTVIAATTANTTLIDELSVGHILGVIETSAEQIADKVDVAENDTIADVEKHGYNVNQTSDYHNYYNSTIYVNKEETSNIWKSIHNSSHNSMLSQAHRRAMTVELTFDFPFYGHSMRNITVATGGFLYTGEYVHSWLAATQYVAPLMANFDTSILNDSFVRLNDNGTAFTVLWENVSLQDKPDVGKFTFSTTLHSNGDIVFCYFSVPTLISTIQDDKHPVKVGLSDAYIIDKIVFFSRRKTIYEYHRVNFANFDITNSTIIRLVALPTCHSFTDCNACTEEQTSFECAWCPVMNRCSSGTDRRKQEWIHRGCEKFRITDSATCPPLGSKGNNAANPNSSYTDYTLQQGNSDANANTYNTGRNIGTSISPALLTPNSSLGLPKFAAASKMHSETEEHQNMGVVMGIFVPISLVALILVWIVYAYRNPHTKSGQLLIQYRPSTWSWRRGEARYTAATIHM